MANGLTPEQLAGRRNLARDALRHALGSVIQNPQFSHLPADLVVEALAETLASLADSRGLKGTDRTAFLRPAFTIMRQRTPRK